MNVKLAQVQSRLEGLGLEFLSSGLESFLAQPRVADLTTLDLVSDLVDLEFLPRKERSARSRIKLSGMPAIKRLEDFDLNWLKGGLTSRKLDELASLQFIERKENIVLLGSSGLGKTHLMLALAHRACTQGYTAYYTTCTDLMESLVRAKEQNRLKRRYVPGDSETLGTLELEYTGAVHAQKFNARREGGRPAGSASVYSRV